MSEIASTPAARPARPSASSARPTHARFVRAWLLALLDMLVLTLRPRLPAGYRRLLARGDDLPPTFLAAFAPDAPAHAPAVALGLVGDWILSGFRNRGMRHMPALRPTAPRRQPARAPPAARSAKKTLLTEGSKPQSISLRFNIIP